MKRARATAAGHHHHHHHPRAFAKCGRVTDCYLPTDRETGDARGFAFVTFEVMSEAEEAIAKMDGAELDGRMLKAVQAPDRTRHIADRSTSRKRAKKKAAAAAAVVGDTAEGADTVAAAADTAPAAAAARTQLPHHARRPSSPTASQVRRSCRRRPAARLGRTPGGKAELRQYIGWRK